MNSEISQSLDLPKIAPQSVRWRHWAVRDDWRNHGPLLTLVAVIVIAAGVSFGSVWAAVVAAAIMAAATWRWWVPIDYEVGIKGLQYHVFGRTRSVTWRSVGRYQVRSDDTVLYRAAAQTPIDAFRGIVVPFGKQREDVLNVLRHYLGPAND